MIAPEMDLSEALDDPIPHDAAVPPPVPSDAEPLTAAQQERAVAVFLSVVTKHRHRGFSARWRGSPNPKDWSNIREVCACGEMLADSKDRVPTALLAHLEHVLREELRR